MPSLAYNKRANYDYEISDKYEAGLVLFGHEVKSIRGGNISLKGAFITIKNSNAGTPELYLINAYVPLYKKTSNIDNYDPERSRKILLHKNQIKRLIGKKQEQGLTMVPISVYTKHNLIKIEFGIGRGKKKIDKRETIKKRDVDRQIRTLTKQKIIT
ncbi:SsrA-binding protein [Candidatus Falkowbacteria bacterium RIFOXYB2_FULL_34_18]|uniref:SsrA-binding protein n=1 Tax=Candidatus Falkowbacteria bacterium RIFOXYD2_FULL_34_120 TaxID=1798007 RepID=A0A1F5TQJ8_9BACT|nr:MAG: SsrA-binding protein [Candidatus Falkowbacteria bacterium RIFOXYB2_FULL_34_18]OGF29485.1 MAG: SsrA-binding protein [Candidatus Falkowbacteria bacterium RIFOXYC12_FULL_34_55]OGF36302.1 MAG: SsrA-binding protein [Candidatus Falkowbacteria bacterium RIFOXYC2_FULL_34_220]OGF39011.1 MAG: SsrA-binding protein [Candidatus Falkowbacteria bacterium RIFOXYD12_FULL_34_57]OGF41230.1 MAG: SsrA-binding protein [Candidatus Falkowbacteria bacterium RIFOXYD2_FULL_34_120]